MVMANSSVKQFSAGWEGGEDPMTVNELRLPNILYNLHCPSEA